MICQVLEQNRTEILVEDAQSVPVAIVTIITENFHITASNCSLQHTANVENAKRVAGNHGEEEADVDGSQDEEDNVPDVEKDEDLLIDDILRHEAENVMVYD